MIELQDVTKTYSQTGGVPVTAVQGANLALECGEFVIVTGRSGSGKTTLLNLAAGLTRPTTGRVFLAGTDLWRLPDRQQALLRNQKVGFVFQFPSLLSALTVLENVTLPTIFGSRQQREGVETRAKDLIERVGLTAKLHVLPRQLSAGQQQRVVIARALINRPEILLADEPTSDLDEQTETEIMDLFSDIHASTGVTILMVTHTSQLVRYGTRAVKMVSGQVMNGKVKP